MVVNNFFLQCEGSSQGTLLKDRHVTSQYALPNMVSIDKLPLIICACTCTCHVHVCVHQHVPTHRKIWRLLDVSALLEVGTRYWLQIYVVYICKVLIYHINIVEK